MRVAGSVPPELQSQVETLPLETLEALAEDLLDFAAEADLQPWLQANT